jgi:phosphate transport system permease protein
MATGALLGIGRAAGETAPILFTVAAFYVPRMPRSVFDQVMTLPYHLYILATQHPEAAQLRPVQYATAVVLLVMVLGLSAGTILLRAQLRMRHRW